MWEVFSGGRSPYPGVDPLGIVELLESGRRLNRPTNVACPDEMLAEIAYSCTDLADCCMNITIVLGYKGCILTRGCV